MNHATIAADLDARRAAALANPAGRRGENTICDFRSQIRTKSETIDGKDFRVLEGYASVVNVGYTMWDWYGEYTEYLSTGAFDKTLAADPDVAFLLNHSGMTMARTRSGTLDLTADEVGLKTVARLNAQRQDVRDLVLAVEDENVDQMSFAFQIAAGHWSPDFTEYWIDEVDLDRGDVSAVNYGASPTTSISARALQAFHAIDALDGAPLRAARDRAQARLTESAPVVSSGPSAATLRARLELEESGL